MNEYRYETKINSKFLFFIFPIMKIELIEYLQIFNLHKVMLHNI